MNAPLVDLYNGVADVVLGGFAKLFRYSLDSFIGIETVDDQDPFSLVTKDCSLTTMIQIDGSHHVIGGEEFEHICRTAELRLKPLLDRRGAAVEFWFSRDPERAARQYEALLRPQRRSAAAIGLDIDDVFDERQRHVPQYLTWELLDMIVTTQRSVLTKAEANRAFKDMRSKQWVKAPRAQFPFLALGELRSRHRGAVDSVLSMLRDLKIQAAQVEAHDALRVARSSFDADKLSEQWKPSLPGDPLPTRQAERREDDLSELLWPSVRSQICTTGAEAVSGNVVQIGTRLWRGTDIELAPQDPQPFRKLLYALGESGVPYRIRFRLQSGGMDGQGMRRFAASVLALTNSDNKRIRMAFEQLDQHAAISPLVRMQISLATWSSADNPKLLDTRFSRMVSAVENWGYCHCSERAGDPLELVMSTTVGLDAGMTAPIAVTPLDTAVTLLPWERPASPHKRGSVIFRTADRKIWPYQPGDATTFTHWFDLYVGLPGGGKSVLANTMDLGALLAPGVKALPYLAIIEIGISSSGLISLLKEGLPLHRRHEAGYHRLKMTPEYAINPFDTQLGSRHPTANEVEFLRNFLSAVALPPGHKLLEDGMSELITMVIDEMYRSRQDGRPGSNAQRYVEGHDLAVDEALKRIAATLLPNPVWWEVVDVLFAAGEVHAATCAQRYAVPTLSDAPLAARHEKIREVLSKRKVGEESIIDIFIRRVSAITHDIPILAFPTKFTIEGTRVCAIDLNDVAPQGSDSANKQTGLMYLLARHVLVHSWWGGEDVVRLVPEQYREYHVRRVRELKEEPKRLRYEEFHRTTEVPFVRYQVTRDGREGRKWNVQVALVSQFLEDFDEHMVGLATAIWIMSAGMSGDLARKFKDRFNLSDTGEFILREHLHGPRKDGAPALVILNTTLGKFEQHVIITLGPIELWAFSTTAEDVAIRNELYAAIGAVRGRRALASMFANGSAKSEVDRRRVARSEATMLDVDADTVIGELVRELTARAERLDLGVKTA